MPNRQSIESFGKVSKMFYTGIQLSLQKVPDLFPLIELTGRNDAYHIGGD